MEKQLPQNIEAECGVLGSIIIDPEAIVQVADFLQGEDFYRDANRTIYETVVQLYEQRIPADFITICDVLERQNKLNEVGGPGYITALINQVPTSGNVEYYGRIVERNAIMRRLAHAAGEIAGVAYSDAEAEEALDKAEQSIFAISQRHTHNDFAALKDLMVDYMEKLNMLHDRRGTIVGVPTGFADLDRLTGGLQRSDLIILAARPAVGKCLIASTLIDDPATGERLTIEECVQRRMPAVYGLSDEGQVRVANISDWIDSGIQPCYRVQTHSGRVVEVTGHHPFLTVHGWVPLHNLQIGQHIAVPAAVPAFGTDESWPLDKVRLLAYFIAEGSLTANSPGFTNIDPVLIEDFKQIIATHFPACSLRQERITYTVAQKKAAYTQKGVAILPANPVTAWLRELGLMGKLSKDKFFPACVWRWSRRYLAEFLKVLMSCDGSIYSAQGCPRIEFGVASPQLAMDVHHALLRFGVITKYYKSGPNAWRVALTNPESIKRYQDKIGWIGEKSARFAEYQHAISRRLGNLGHAPKEIWQTIRSGATREKLPLIELARRCGETTRTGKYAGYNAHIGRGVPRYRLAAYAEILADASLRLASSEDVYWDKIIAIEPVGEHQVYDLTVPDGANFIAQDVFVHNTSLALSLAHNSALKHQQSVAVFSLEMSKEQLVQRLLSMDAAIDQQRLRTGWIEDDEWERIVIAMENLSQGNIWIDDTAGISTTEMRSKARRLQAEHGVDLIIVDYLQLMQSTMNGKRNENRVQEVSEISRNLKGLARELDVPVLALAQLSRTVESRQSKVPQLSDLRESGCLTGESLVYLPDEGIYKRIDSLVGQHGFNVLAVNEDTWKLEKSMVTNAFSTGHKLVYKLTTRKGNCIRATANHKFLSFKGWLRLDEMSEGMHIALPRTLPESVGTAFMPSSDLSLSTTVEVCQHLYDPFRGRDQLQRVRDLSCSSPARNDERERNMINPDALKLVPTPIAWLGEWVQLTFDSAVGTRFIASGDSSPCTISARLLPGFIVMQGDESPDAINRVPTVAGDVYWDEVVDIQPDGEEEVYDLTVNGLHNFVANNIIVHNSIEQDADIVMFIYRDDVYNPDSERKNIADIIVAKHRNGPVGEVSLYFQASQTRFRDLEVTPPVEE